MLKRRIIPKLQLVNLSSSESLRPALCITKSFKKRRVIGAVLSQAKIYESQLVDELMLINIDSSSFAESHLLLDSLKDIATHLSTPLSVGGGVRSVDDIELLLGSGADKVVINSSAHSNPNILERGSYLFGSQCIVVSIDYYMSADGSSHSFIEGGKIPFILSPLELMRQAVDHGAGEIILTCINNDGTGKGLDLAYAKSFIDICPLPVIISGGCGVAQHFVDGFKCGASGIASGTYFTQRDQNPMQCRAHVYNSGIPVRISL